MFPQEQNDSADIIKNSVHMYNMGDNYDIGIRGMVSRLMMKLIVPWLNQCFEKYTDYDFHFRMSQGFSFVADWKTNHAKRYGQFMSLSRRLYQVFGIRLDEEYVIQTVQNILAQRGWNLYQEEVDTMRRDLQQLKQEIEY